jgi:hypothetical protein
MLNSGLPTRENSSEPLKPGNTPPKDLQSFQSSNSPKDSLLMQATATSVALGRQNSTNSYLAPVSGSTMINRVQSPLQGLSLPNSNPLQPLSSPSPANIANRQVKSSNASTPSNTSISNQPQPSQPSMQPPTGGSNNPPAYLELLNLTSTTPSSGLNDNFFNPSKTQSHHPSCTNHDHPDPCDVHEQMKIQNFQDSHVFRVSDMDSLEWGDFPDFGYNLSSF